jgi:SecD/SecF fusion protein
MKTIKYIITAIVILSMCMGSFSNLRAQEAIQFMETYKRSEITSRLDKDDHLFELLNSSDTDPEGAKLGTCVDADSEELWDYLHSKEFGSHFPEDLHFVWGWSSEESSLTLYALRETPGNAPGKMDLQSVSVQESARRGSYSLLISFSKKGAESWARMTRENIGKNIAIVIEGKVVTAPVVQSEIKQGKCLISGNYTKEEMAEMKALLEK